MKTPLTHVGQALTAIVFVIGGQAYHGGMPSRTASSRPVCTAAALAALVLSACAGPSARLGVGVPVGPFSVGVGVGSGGVSAGVGTGVGPVGVGVGVHPSGQVTGGVGVGASVPMGGAHVGAGVGSSTVLHDPYRPPQPPAPAAPSSDSPPMQWRDAHGRIVPECQVRGGC